jgi:hypothetical protein
VSEILFVDEELPKRMTSLLHWWLKIENRFLIWDANVLCVKTNHTEESFKLKAGATFWGSLY